MNDEDKPYIWLGPFVRQGEAYRFRYGLFALILYILFPWVWNLLVLTFLLITISFLFGG